MTFRIVGIESTFVEPAFQLATGCFVEGSTLHRALEIGLTEYKEYLAEPFRCMIAEGLSVAAVDGSSGKMLGCLVATDFFHQLSDESILSGRFGPLRALTRALCRQYVHRRPAVVGDALLVDMAVVAPGYGGQGIYQGMRASAHELAKRNGFRRVVGELSSAATQHVVLGRLGHQQVAEVRFSDFEIGGRRPFSSISEPPSIILSEGVL